MADPPATLDSALRATAERSRGHLHFHLGDESELLTGDLLLERAEQAAGSLLAYGIEPGERIAILGQNRPEWVTWAFATWLVGACVVPVQFPLRVRRPEAFAERVQALCAAASCRAVVVAPNFAEHVPPELALPWDLPERATTGRLPGSDPEAAAVIQFTSGSTAFPKGALITHRAAIAQMELLRRAYGMEPKEPVRLCWSPFFHDLGLVKDVIYGVWSGARSHFLPTDRFVRDAGEFVRLASRTRATTATAPSTVWRAAVRSALRRPEQIDLSAMRIAWFGAEPVDPDAADGVVAACPTLGLDLAALGSTYGLAEAVLGVCVQHEGLREESIGLEEMASERRAAVRVEGPRRRIYSAGPPIAGVEVRIKRGSQLLDEREIGEIQVLSPSLMSGYVGGDGDDPFDAGWLRTGDLGYLAEGELFVTGRLKDMAIVMGHNYYPEDFEWAATRVAGVREGKAVAFSSAASEGLVVLVEARKPSELAGLCMRIHESLKAEIGVAPAEVAVLPRGAIKRTTSGKLRRSEMRSSYLACELEVLDRQ